jgi:hypothetical protein
MLSYVRSVCCQLIRNPKRRACTRTYVLLHYNARQQTRINPVSTGRLGRTDELMDDSSHQPTCGRGTAGADPKIASWSNRRKLLDVAL